ncbi:MAG TPA: hypothetical protein PK808_03805, partial [Polymorphobacter sp.]|nr:hypothetical protein [Polymorphobacter sp.]
MKDDTTAGRDLPARHRRPAKSTHVAPVPDDALVAPDERWLVCEIGAMTPEQIDEYCDRLSPKLLDNLAENWRHHARQAQLPPGGDWDSWLILAGRGFGKTRAGAGWVHECAAQPMAASAAVAETGTPSQSPVRIALIGATLADARAVMVEGESGLLATAPPDMQPRFEPSLR